MKFKTPKISNFKKLNKIVLLIIISIFAIQCYLFVTTIRHGGPPDENYHLAMSSLQYSEAGINPTLENREDTYIYGDISRIPYLYYKINGFLLKLKPYNFPAWLYLRLFNPLLIIAAIIFVYKTALLISKSKKVVILSLLMFISPISMIFQSAAVTYDNLVNLLAASSFYYLIKITKRYPKNIQKSDMLFFILSLLLGSLTKYTFIPLAAIYVFIFIIVIIKKSSSSLFKDNLNNLFGPGGSKPLYYLSLLLVLFFTFLNLQLIGVNIFRYKSLTPTCGKILAEENCMQSALYKRNKELTNKTPGKNNIIKYTSEWYGFVRQTSFGIYGHGMKAYNVKLTGIINGLLITILILILLNIKNIWKNKYFLITIIIPIVYLVMMILYGYASYRKTGIVALGLHGRYIFPVLPMIAISAAQLMFLNFRKNKYIFYILSAVFVFLLHYNGFYYFYTKTIYKSDFQKSIINWDKAEDETFYYHRFLVKKKN